MADRWGDLMTRLDAAAGVAGDERAVAEIMVAESAERCDEQHENVFHAASPLTLMSALPKSRIEGGRAEMSSGSP